MFCKMLLPEPTSLRLNTAVLLLCFSCCCVGAAVVVLAQLLLWVEGRTSQDDGSSAVLCCLHTTTHCLSQAFDPYFIPSLSASIQFETSRECFFNN